MMNNKTIVFVCTAFIFLHLYGAVVMFVTQTIEYFAEVRRYKNTVDPYKWYEHILPVFAIFVMSCFWWIFAILGLFNNKTD